MDKIRGGAGVPDPHGGGSSKKNNGSSGKVGSRPVKVVAPLVRSNSMAQRFGDFVRSGSNLRRSLSLRKNDVDAEKSSLRMSPGTKDKGVDSTTKPGFSLRGSFRIRKKDGGNAVVKKDDWQGGAANIASLRDMQQRDGGNAVVKTDDWQGGVENIASLRGRVEPPAEDSGGSKQIVSYRHSPDEAQVEFYFGDYTADFFDYRLSGMTYMPDPHVVRRDPEYQHLRMRRSIAPGAVAGVNAKLTPKVVFTDENRGKKSDGSNVHSILKKAAGKAGKSGKGRDVSREAVAMPYDMDSTAGSSDRTHNKHVRFNDGKPKTVLIPNRRNLVPPPVRKNVQR